MLEQGRERGLVLSQIVQQLADVRVGRGEEHEPVAGADSSLDDEATVVLENRECRLTAARRLAEARGLAHGGGGERRDGLAVEAAVAGRFDGQAVGAGKQNGLDAGTLEQAVNELGEVRHRRSHRRNVGIGVTEVKKGSYGPGYAASDTLTLGPLGG